MEKVKSGVKYAFGAVVGVFITLMVIGWIIAGYESLQEPTRTDFTTRGYTAEDRKSFIQGCLEEAPGYESYCTCMWENLSSDYTYEEFLNYYNGGMMFELIEPYVAKCVSEPTTQWR